MNKPVYVTGFQRTGNGIEVMYYEAREQSRNAGISRSLIMSDTVEDYNKLIEEAVETLEELVELVVQDIRNPAQSLNPRERKMGADDLDE